MEYVFSRTVDVENAYDGRWGFVVEFLHCALQSTGLYRLINILYGLVYRPTPSADCVLWSVDHESTIVLEYFVRFNFTNKLPQLSDIRQLYFVNYMRSRELKRIEDHDKARAVGSTGCTL